MYKICFDFDMPQIYTNIHILTYSLQESIIYVRIYIRSNVLVARQLFQTAQ